MIPSAYDFKTLHPENEGISQLVKYILCALEKHASGQDYDLDSHAFNIEHILPQSPGLGWEEFTEEEVETLVFRLGNLTLLSSSENRAIGNATYDEKRQAYVRSPFVLTSELAQQYADWTPTKLATRQSWMARQATSIWRIDQLS